MYTAGDIRWGYNIYVGVYIYSGIIYIPRYVVVSWFLPCMGFEPGEGCTIPCTLIGTCAFGNYGVRSPTLQGECV